MGVFVNALGLAVGQQRPGEKPVAGRQAGRQAGLGAWLLSRLRRRPVRASRLAVVERINLAPRQTLTLIEADGQRVLVATSGDGVPAFFPLGAAAKPARARKAATEKGKRP